MLLAFFLSSPCQRPLYPLFRVYVLDKGQLRHQVLLREYVSGLRHCIFLDDMGPFIRYIQCVQSWTPHIYQRKSDNSVLAICRTLIGDR